MPIHTVSEGDCLSSIAERYGFFWETLWNHPENEHLVRDRKDPNTLMVGDAVFVPEKRMKRYLRATGARYAWQVRGVPVKFRVQVQWGDAPMANEPYMLTIDDAVHEGTTDGEGRVEVTIRPGARSGLLRVGTGDRMVEHPLVLGALPPVTETVGVLERLRNLGFYRGERRDDLNDDARAALRAFQQQYALDLTGEVDDAVRAALRHLHDGV